MNALASVSLAEGALRCAEARAMSQGLGAKRTCWNSVRELFGASGQEEKETSFCSCSSRVPTRRRGRLDFQELSPDRDRPPFQRDLAGRDSSGGVGAAGVARDRRKPRAKATAAISASISAA